MGTEQASPWDLGLRHVTPYLLLPFPPWLQHHPGGQEALGVPVGRQEVTLLRGGSKLLSIPSLAIILTSSVAAVATKALSIFIQIA